MKCEHCGQEVESMEAIVAKVKSIHAKLVHAMELVNSLSEERLQWLKHQKLKSKKK